MSLKHVYYSKTTDNPFLHPSYVKQLSEDFDPKMKRRMIDGEWLDIEAEVIYYQYSSDNWVPMKYEVNERYPIYWTHDQNIGEGKPMSSVFYQRIDRIYHFFAEIVVEGARTMDICEEAADRGLLDYHCKYIVKGDASGRNRDTRSKKSDYELIDHFMLNYERPDGTQLEYERKVPKSNPPLRKRHNWVNGQCKNAFGEIKLYVYDGCETLDKGFRLTKLKSGGQYIEDDSLSFQHVTTAAGYGICSDLIAEKRGSTKSIQL